MVVISASGIEKAFGIDNILSNCSFHINQGDRVGIIGENGAGKSTLLSILSGELASDAGDLFRSSTMTLGHLKQRDAFHSEKTVYEEMLSLFSAQLQMEQVMDALSHQIGERSAKGEEVAALLHDYADLQDRFAQANGYGFRSEVNGMLSKMAFPEAYYHKKISTLSGGERTRLALAALLLQKPDLLLLDEPTNHLDIGTLTWLEQYLKSYTGTIVLISHDRYFLDQTVGRIFEIASTNLTVYEGNYSTYLVKKQQKDSDASRQYERQQKEIARQEEIIRRFKGHGTEKLVKRAQSREKRLAQLDRLERPEQGTGHMSIRFQQDFKSGNDVVRCSELSMSFEQHGHYRQLFQNVSFDLKRGERICLVGPNGIGKTTLLKLMMGLLSPDTGEIETGHNVVFGYYDQDQQFADGQRTVLGEMMESYPSYTQTELRSLLGRFLFHNDDVFKRIEELSGGERARVALLKLMLSGANVLLMDEPTNHLDIGAKEAFESALLSYPGTLFVISHDRFLLNKIPTRILELTTHGIGNFLGTYDYYMEKKQSIASANSYLGELRKSAHGPGDETDPEASPLSSKEKKLDDRKRAKEEEAARRRHERSLEAAEQDVAKWEAEILTLEAEMGREEHRADYDRLTSYSHQLAEAKRSLDEAYDRWLSLQESEK